MHSLNPFPELPAGKGLGVPVSSVPTGEGGARAKSIGGGSDADYTYTIQYYTILYCTILYYDVGAGAAGGARSSARRCDFARVPRIVTTVVLITLITVTINKET